MNFIEHLLYTELLPSLTLMGSSTGMQSTVNPSVSSNGPPMQATSTVPSTLTSQPEIPQSTISSAPLPSVTMTTGSLSMGMPSVTMITGSFSMDMSTMAVTTPLPSPSGMSGPQNGGTDGGVIAGAVIVVLVILVAMVTVTVVILAVIKRRRSRSVPSESYHEANLKAS